jgi:hypothetical protein
VPAERVNGNHLTDACGEFGVKLAVRQAPGAHALDVGGQPLRIPSAHRAMVARVVRTGTQMQERSQIAGDARREACGRLWTRRRPSARIIRQGAIP